MQTVQNLKDALLQGGAAHNRVVDNHQVIHTSLQAAVADVVNVGSQIVALAVVGNKGAQFNILPHHLLGTHVAVQLTESVCHPIKGHLGGVRDIGKN